MLVLRSRWLGPMSSSAQALLLVWLQGPLGTLGPATEGGFFLPPSVAVSCEGQGWGNAPAQGTMSPSGTRGGVVSGATGMQRSGGARSCCVQSPRCATDLLTSPFVWPVLERPQFQCLGVAALAGEVPGWGM